MQHILIANTLLAIMGAYLTANSRWEGFAAWLVTNSIFMIHNFNIGEWQQGMLFSIYLLISLQGLINFRRKQIEQCKNYDVA